MIRLCCIGGLLVLFVGLGKPMMRTPDEVEKLPFAAWVEGTQLKLYKWETRATEHISLPRGDLTYVAFDAGATALYLIAPASASFAVNEKGATQLESTSPVRPIYSVAVSQGTAYISGETYTPDGKRCGIFTKNLNTGAFGEILNDATACDYLTSYHSLSVSSDHRYVVYGRDRAIVALDLVRNTSAVIARGVYPHLSPDGTRVAYVDDRGHLCVVKREVPGEVLRLPVMPRSRAAWSPDGQYVLYTDDAWCLAYRSTLRAVHVSTGRVITAISSRCQIATSAFGWFGDQGR